MKTLKGILTKKGVFYKNPLEETDLTLILEEVFDEKIFGFRAYYSLTGKLYNSSAMVGNEIGDPSIYLIFDDCAVVDYSKSFKEALKKAHNYLFKIIQTEMFEPFDCYQNLLDKTQIGKDLFAQKELKFDENKANLSE